MATPFANAAATQVIEIASAALSQPTLVATSSAALTRPFLEQAPAADRHALAPAAVADSASGSHPAPRPAAAPAEPASGASDWSMLLFGAGVLLLPRKRRVDNVVR
ncbi:hypothetical protein GJV26_15305 [Massilia dura]|uniref:Uncharacterized protein n=1 Tax=Pseudoduganella dura TaxID=321982 RepID=A0A6I3XGY0_9BURK|nr:hypothetical protein [Pseudoduganella dura]MUI13810.1 hypothetical protein [Pseudoduganella dura]GGY10942.1 hypothetical protein GCM10007386_46570 [Pseudoduganella dura]